MTDNLIASLRSWCQNQGHEYECYQEGTIMEFDVGHYGIQVVHKHREEYGVKIVRYETFGPARVVARRNFWSSPEARRFLVKTLGLRRGILGPEGGGK